MCAQENLYAIIMSSFTVLLDYKVQPSNSNLFLMTLFFCHIPTLQQSIVKLFKCHVLNPSHGPLSPFPILPLQCSLPSPSSQATDFLIFILFILFYRFF